MAGVPEIGDRVHVPGIGTGVLTERRGTRGVVDIKGRPVVVPLDRLTPAEPTRRRPKPSAGPPARPDADPLPTSTPTLDLHGLTVAEALESLEAFLSHALLAGHATVVVVHGRSGGRLRGAVHSRLGALGPVRGFTVDPRNPGQTLVSF